MNLCRFCTEKTLFADGYQIFEKHDIGGGDKKSIDEMIVYKEYPLDIKDELPKISCRKCFHKIVDGYNFYIMVKRSEESLIAIREQINSGEPNPILPKPYTQERKYVRCIDCNKRFDSDENLKEHITEEHKPKKRLYKCLECDANFRSYRHLKDHRSTHSNDGFCSFCNMGIFTKIMLRLHTEAEHTNSKFICRICDGKTFSNKFLLCNHIKTIHKVTGNLYFCYYCEEQFNDKTLIEEHLKSHPLEDTELSEQKFSQDDNLSMNEEFLDEFLLNEDKNDDLPEYCWDNLSFNFDDLSCGCNSSMPDKKMSSTLTTDPNITTGAPSKQYKCPMCTEEFEKQWQMNVHLAKDHKQYILSCKICGEKFNKLDDLRKHRTKHDSQRTKSSELFCKICNKTFKTKQGMLYHTFSHKSKEQDSICLFCGKGFTTALNLGSHVKIMHSNVKKHVCSLCDRPFSTLDHLKKHVLSFHQKERNFLCFLCGKGYSQSSHLKKHMQVHGKTDVTPEETNTKESNAE